MWGCAFESVQEDDFELYVKFILMPVKLLKNEVMGERRDL